MRSHTYGTLEAYYIDSSTNIKHKTFIDVPLHSVSGNLQRFYIHITAKNRPIKKRREPNDFEPLQYPLVVSNHYKTKQFHNFYINALDDIMWISPRSTKQRLIFDRFFRIKLLQKPNTRLQSMVDDVITHYTKEFHVDLCLNDLIFKYYDETKAVRPVQYLHDLFSKRLWPYHDVVVPSNALHAVREWLQKLNIVQYPDSPISQAIQKENTLSDIEGENESETESEIKIYCEDDSEESDVWQVLSTRHKDDWGYYSPEDTVLVNEADYDLKYKLSHKKLTSRSIRRKAKRQHDRYARAKKKTHRKYVCMDMDGIRLKIKSKEHGVKYAKKPCAVKQRRRIVRAGKHSKKSQRHTNRLLKLRLIDNRVAATYWSVPPYDFVC